MKHFIIIILLLFSTTLIAQNKKELKKELELKKEIIDNLNKSLNNELSEKSELKSKIFELESQYNELKETCNASLMQSAYQSQTDKQLYDFLQGEIIESKSFKLNTTDLLDGELPKSFKNRTFWDGLSISTYDIFRLPGQIIKKVGSNEYKPITVVPVIRENSIIENEIINDGVLFNDMLTKEKKLNGSFIIGGFEAKSDEVIEVSLTDLIKSSPDKDSIDIEKLKKYKEFIKDRPDSENYYFVNSALLTIGTGRKFKKSQFKKSVNTIYLTIGGSVYKSEEQIKKERIISIEITSLNDMILE